MENKLMFWGFSMYGGYYAEVIINGKYTGIHTDTYKELKNKLEQCGMKPTKEKRMDN